MQSGLASNGAIAALAEGLPGSGLRQRQVVAIGDIRQPDLPAAKLPVEREHRHLKEAHCGGQMSAGSPRGD